MSYLYESYSDRWIRCQKEKQATTLKGQSVNSVRGLGSVVSTTAVQSKNPHSMSMDVPLTKPDVNPVVQLSIDLRKKLGFTQAAFARRLNISVRTLNDWEQSRRQPSGPALTLLLLIVRHPEYITDMDKVL